MRADWDDAPQHLQSRRKGDDVAKLPVAGVVGRIITFGALYLFGSLFEGDSPESAPNADAEHFTPFEQLNDVAPPQKTAEQMFWESVEAGNRREAEANAAKQKAFNDSNYTPKQPMNTYSPPTYKEVASQSQSQTRRVQRERDGQWIDKWSGGARYYAEWEIINNYIENTSVCANHRRGSIDYRECRKGAKQFFKEQCKGWCDRYQSDRKPWGDLMKQRYCSAASNFNPMG